MDDKYIESFSLIERMDNPMTLSESKDYKEKILNDIIKEKHYPHSDDIFDLDKIPMEILDNINIPLEAFNMGLPYRHPLRMVMETVDYKSDIETVKKIITETYHMDSSLFIIDEGENSMFAAILVSVSYGNINVIEKAMEKLGYYRTNPTDDKLLEDKKYRKYVNLRFEPINANDITNEIRTNYKYLYHTSPSIFEKNILENGLIPSNSNSEFRYNEPRVYLFKGDSTIERIQELVNELYLQAKQKGFKDLSPKYTLFTIDTKAIPSETRFFADINEDDGLYIMSKIKPDAIIKTIHLIAKE